MSIATDETHAVTPADLAAKLWGKADVAQVFRVSEVTVKRWVQEGRLPAPTSRIGHRLFWSADVITELATRGSQVR
jgi:predicted site-specific integrase-resolvase